MESAGGKEVKGESVEGREGGGGEFEGGRDWRWKRMVEAVREG